MKVVFFTTYMTTPHFETEMELMYNHLRSGDEVFAIECRGSLHTCLANPTHQREICMDCQGKFRSGMKILENRIKTVPFPSKQPLQYPEIPLSFDSIEQLREFKIGCLQLGLCAASTLISRLNRDHGLDTRKYSGEITSELNTALYLYRSSIALFSQIEPDRIYLFNGRFTTSLPIINACEELGIPFSTHDRGGPRDSYQIYESTTPHDLDFAARDIREIWSSFPEEEALQTGRAFYEDRRRRVEHSWHSYTKAQELGYLPSDYNPQKKNFVFFNTTIEEFAAVRDRPPHLMIYKDECDAMGQITQSFLNDPDVHFYLRVHPNQRGYDNTQSREIAALAEKTPNITVIPPESKVDSYSLMEAATAVITFGSTMGAEACYWNKTSVLLGRAYYEKFDCSYIPANHEEVVQTLQANLPPRNQIGAIMYGFWEAKRGTRFEHFVPDGLFGGTFDGHRIQAPLSTRLKIFFLKIIANRKPKTALPKLWRRIRS
jgi:hypothetical protein